MQEIDSESVRVFVCDLSNAFASSKYCEHKRGARNRLSKCVRLYVICQMPLLVQNTVNTNVMQKIDLAYVCVCMLFAKCLCWFKTL